MGLSRKVLIYFYLLTSLLQGYNENIKKINGLTLYNDR